MRSNWLLKKYPTRMNDPDHSRPPNADHEVKRQRGIPVTPAIGGAAVFRPGMNFATSRERAPYRWKVSSARRTQESGSMEILHRKPRMEAPRRRPSWYQTVSLI